MTITNNVGKSDVVYVTDVMGGDTINVYNAAIGGKIIGKTTVSSSKTDATVYVIGLAQGDVVKLYTSATKGKLLGSATVGGNRTEATISISQLGVNSGSIYLSVISKGMKESGRVKADFLGESQSEVIDPNNVTITNNSGKADIIYVTGLTSGDKINIYNAASDAGSVYVSLTNLNKLEGDRTKADYIAEATSDSLDASNVSVTNRSGSADTVSITGASQNDVINVYDLAKGGTLLGTATVVAGETKD